MKNSIWIVSVMLVVMLVLHGCNLIELVTENLDSTAIEMQNQKEQTEEVIENKPNTEVLDNEQSITTEKKKMQKLCLYLLQ